MAFLGMRAWPTPFLKPMWPFMIGAAITFYGVASAQSALSKADVYANDPRNPFASKKPAAH